MQITEKLQVKNIIKELPDECTFEDIQYHIYVAEKLKNARKQIKDVNTHSIGKVKERLGKWIIK